MTIRLFAVLAILAIGLAALKALSISSEILMALDPAKPAFAAASKEKASKHKESKPAKRMPDITEEAEPVAETCKSPGFAEQVGLSEQELRVVMRLSERREELDSREQDLKTREAVVLLSEAKLDERLEQIEAAIAKYDERIGQLDELEEARVRQVVKTYETMKPRSAAVIFNTLNDKVLLQVATRMKPQSMAKILAAMDTQRATNLTIKMTEQFARPENAEALLAGNDVKDG